MLSPIPSVALVFFMAGCGTGSAFEPDAAADAAAEPADEALCVEWGRRRRATSATRPD